MSIVGRIISSTLEAAKAEIIDELNEGDLLIFKIGDDEIPCRVERLEQTPYKGLIGWISFREHPLKPPKSMTPLYRLIENASAGIVFIGIDKRGQEVRLELNPLFSHMIIGGITQQGKTHLMIVMVEELLEKKVPCFIIDSQGEFVNLPEINKDAFVVEEIRIADLLAHLRERHIVIWNLLGLPKTSKIQKVGDLLQQLIFEKEMDYQIAEGNIKLTMIPPLLMFVDEAELYAPTMKSSIRLEGAEISTAAMIDIVKRGTKIGLGMIVSSQRLPMLNVDVRSQCNSAAIFHLGDIGSLNMTMLLDYMTQADLRNISSLLKGECMLLGNIVRVPKTVRIRDIRTRRSKTLDFEKVLGIEPETPTASKKEPFAPKIVKRNGDIIDKDTNEVLETGLERLTEEDKAVFDKAKGDGIVIRDSITEDEEQAITSVRKSGELIPKKPIIFLKGHVSEEEQKILKDLRLRGKIG